MPHRSQSSDSTPIPSSPPPHPPPQSSHTLQLSQSTQSSTPPVKRRRTRPPTPPPQPQPQLEDDENTCTICLEPWTNTGDHQLCCMPCGHLFGYECIANWLKCKPKRTRACPTCKTPGRVKDLRYLFGVPAKLRTMDTTDIDRLKQQLEQERSKHHETKQRLDEARRLARTYREVMIDLQRARAPVMERSPQPEIDDVSLIGVRSTKGGSIAIACDGATILYTENTMSTPSEQRLCRTEIHKLSNVTWCPHTFSKRVNAIAVCAQRDMSRYIAVASADRRVTVLTPTFQLAAEVTVSAVPTSVVWLSTPHHLAVGLLNGEVAIFDVRNPSGAPVLRPLVADRGWRAVHSLAEIGTQHGNRLIAGAPCGVVAISPHTGFVEDVDVGEGPITGVSVHGGLLLVASKPEKPRLSVYDSLTTVNGTVQPRQRIGDALTGYKHDIPFIQPAILQGLGDRKGSIVLCPDNESEHGVASWGFRRDGVDGERWVRHNPGNGKNLSVRSVACASIPSTAKIVGLPEKIRGVFATVGNDSVRLFSAGRYR